jgi:Anti-sigma-28 factor, FlgM
VTKRSVGDFATIPAINTPSDWAEDMVRFYQGAHNPGIMPTQGGVNVIAKPSKAKSSTERITYSMVTKVEADVGQKSRKCLPVGLAEEAYGMEMLMVREILGPMDIKSVAAMVRCLPDVRADLVARVKAEIQAGQYETPERIERAVEGLMADLCIDITHQTNGSDSMWTGEGTT